MEGAQGVCPRDSPSPNPELSVSVLQIDTPISHLNLQSFIERREPSPASERRGNNLNGLKDFYLKAKARISP